MAKKILQVIESAYRGTLEEQDDTVVWLTHAMKGQGGTLDVLLTGNAVNYTVKGQDASGLRFGERAQTQPPRLADDLAGLMGKGVKVFLVEEDLAARGIEGKQLIDGLQKVSRVSLPSLFGNYDQIWRW
jgi:sulfur relay (sulfurtransferase) DsrF/TusC family protein